MSVALTSGRTRQYVRSETVAEVKRVNRATTVNQNRQERERQTEKHTILANEKDSQ